MARPDKPHFSNKVLDLGERTHRAIGHTKIGTVATRSITGSKYPGYRQLDWYSRGVSTDVKTTIIVPGDPNAGLVPRFWNKAAIIATSNEDVESIKGGHYKEAIAYVSDDVVHVGVHATEWALFGELNKEERAVSMRLGNKPLEAAMGIWLPNERHFISVENLKVVEAAALVSRLDENYPGIHLA